MIFKKFFKNLTVNNPSEVNQGGFDWLSGILGTSNTSISGENITKEGSLNISRVYACVDYRANAIAKMPFQVFKNTKEGNIRQRGNIASLLETRPNMYMTPFRFKHTLSTHVDLYGNAYVYMETSNGTISNLWILMPQNTQIVKQMDGTIVYQTSINGKNYIFDSEEIIHLNSLTTDGIVGKSKIDVLKEDLGNTVSSNKLLGKFFAQGTLGGGVLTYPTKLESTAKNTIREEWQKANAGADNAGKIRILDLGLDYKELNTMKLADQQFLENVKLTKEQIAEVFQVPPTVLGDLSRGTFNNTEQMQLSFILNTMQPIVTSWEQEFSYKLFASYQRSQGYFIQANMSSSLRGDDKTRSEFYEKMTNNGFMSINEVRAKENLNSIGEMGDKYYRSLNYVNVDVMEDYQLSKANADNRIKGGVKENGQDN